jgi:hypothetical protein
LVLIRGTSVTILFFFGASLDFDSPSLTCMFIYRMYTQVYTNGNPYGIAEDIVFSMPCRSKVCLKHGLAIYNIIISE